MADGPRQGGLFGPLEDADRDPDRVDACAPSADAQAIAAALPKQLRMGTSSWAFPGWRGLVYAKNAPAKSLSRSGLSAYAQHPLLWAVGVDRTFYAPIARQDFADYASQVGPSFRFLVKAWGELTSPTLRGRTGLNPRYLDADSAIDDVLTPAFEGLDQKLGPLLFQFPPQGATITKRPEAFADDLHRFLSALPKGPHYAIELRDRALMTPRYVDAIAAASARHCYCVHPRMPSLAEQLAIAPIETAEAQPIAVRWMLHAGLSYEQAKERYQPFARLTDPDDDSRRGIAAIAAKAVAMDVPMTVVVNNKAEGCAPASILELARAIVEATRSTEST